VISQATYQNTKRDIHQLGVDHTTELLPIQSIKAVQPALKHAFKVANQYHSQLVPLVYSRLDEVGLNAVNFYAPEWSEDQKRAEVNQALDALTHNRYYGQTLPERLGASNKQLRMSIRKSAVTGAKPETRMLNITRVFTSPYPHGAHETWDSRLFLAEAVRMEHEIAVSIAGRKKQMLIRWETSHIHTALDVCDVLANAVDPKVAKAYPAIDPTGVYFVYNTPRVPHPNCQCVVKYVQIAPVKLVITPEQPAKKALIRRIIDSIFKRK
jgi:hypothetical protein